MLEAMEPRACLSGGVATGATAGDSGVDALGMGDFNADQIADIAVASHEGGHYVVTIYDGDGQNAATATGFAPKVLATITDPLGPGVGPLDVAVGDFTGSGVSDLAISSTGTGAAASSKVAVYKFTLVNSSPVNSPVTPVLLGKRFIPAGLGNASGVSVAAADTHGSGVAQLIAGAAHGGNGHISILSYSETSGLWTADQVLKNLPLAKGGVSLDAGEIAGDGSTEIVVGSRVNGKVAIYDTAISQVVWTGSPVGSLDGGVRVAAVPAVNQPGAIVVTGASTSGQPVAALVPWGSSSGMQFLPISSPGAGNLIPMGGGYVYQRSTIQALDTPFPYSNGPTAPTVILGSKHGSQLIVQGFAANNTPSAPDTYVEPLAGPVGVGFTPLQAPGDTSATGGSSSVPATESIPSNLIIYPQQLTYYSPYRIDLSGAPASIYAGLFSPAPLTSSVVDPWGPNRVTNAPPNLPSTDVSKFLQERLLAAYQSEIGIDYQHHYTANWLPTQGSIWNLTSTVGYQSEGIDCTNFTSYCYDDALGITMNSDTGQQALISPTNPNGTIIPESLSGAVSITTITHWSSYADLVSQLQPGDILFIHGNPADRSQVTHAITWLGMYGVDKNGKGVPLIIDATGNAPEHVNSNNQVIREGVQIRPFGPPGSTNDWYYENLDHVLRLIDTP
jgi:hypothetical protein